MVKIQQSWDVSGGLPEDKVHGIFHERPHCDAGIDKCLFHLTAVSESGVTLVLVFGTLSQDQSTGGRQLHWGTKKHHLPNIKCRQ